MLISTFLYNKKLLTKSPVKIEKSPFCRVLFFYSLDKEKLSLLPPLKFL